MFERMMENTMRIFQIFPAGRDLDVPDGAARVFGGARGGDGAGRPTLAPAPVVPAASRTPRGACRLPMARGPHPPCTRLVPRCATGARPVNARPQ